MKEWYIAIYIFISGILFPKVRQKIKDMDFFRKHFERVDKNH